MNKQLNKYLQSRATQAPWKISSINSKEHQAAIIIPALAESESLPKTIASIAANPAEFLQQTLILIVVNNRASASDNERQDNQQTLAWLEIRPFPNLNLGWVDASSAGFELPEKEGVGLARKIGFDLVLSTLNWLGNPILISLDADTLVDENYLPAIFGFFDKSECGGMAIPFRHQEADEQQVEKAIRTYELYLRSYLFGLQQAGSPYAYHTIGSAFACTAAAYIASGGMNRRPAAEDFYFLQQVAKTSSVELVSGTVVRPSPRFSKRVPFGTGRAVQAQVDENLQQFQFTDAKAFAVLKDWLELVSCSCDLNAEEVLSKAGDISTELEQFLVELKFEQSWQRLQQNYSTDVLQLRGFHQWFDALRARQLLTRLSDVEQERGALIGELLSWGGYPNVEDVQEQLQLLEKLQGVK